MLLLIGGLLQIFLIKKIYENRIVLNKKLNLNGIPEGGHIGFLRKKLYLN